MELYTLESPELEKLWLKALDPVGCAMVPVEEFQTFLERIARGSMSEEATAVSSVFSESMVTLMELEDCISDNRHNMDRCVDMAKLRAKIQSKVMDVELFNQLLKQDCLFEVKSINHRVD